MGTLQLRSVAALAFAAPLPLAATLSKPVKYEMHRRPPYSVYVKRRA
jgi:hypothetical protein